MLIVSSFIYVWNTTY
ncbi:LpxT activity modulator PmrR [Salmonella enterica subsp. enterica]|nr:LpxT activity modulator PmrR [Salmonella enterica subsp. enterica]